MYHGVRCMFIVLVALMLVASSEPFWSGVLLGVFCRAQIVLSFVLPARPLRPLVGWLGSFVFLSLRFFW